MKRPVDELEPHPFNLEVFWQERDPDAGLAESLDRSGQRVPIDVTPEGLILSGVRRWTAAKALGWDEIEVLPLALSEEDEKDHIILTNTYREAGHSYIVKKRMADHWREKLEKGEVTKEELEEKATPGGGGEYGGEHPKDPNRNYPLNLAARVVDNFSPNTYQRLNYLLDGKAKADIEEAEESEEVDSDSAEKLKEDLSEDVEKVVQGKKGIRTAADGARQRLEQAKIDHTYTEKQKRVQAAEDAVNAAAKRGRTFLNTLRDLEEEGHIEVLDGSEVLVLTNLVAEIAEEIRSFATSEEEKQDVYIGDVSELEPI